MSIVATAAVAAEVKVGEFVVLPSRDENRGLARVVASIHSDEGYVFLTYLDGLRSRLNPTDPLKILRVNQESST